MTSPNVHLTETFPTATARSSWDRGSSRPVAALVTGAGGEVGHGLLSALHEAGRDVVAMDLAPLGAAQAALTRETVVGDVRDRARLEHLEARFEITEIYHLAAILSTRTEFTPEAAHDVNVGGTLNLLRLAAEQARSHGKRVRFLFPSSIAVYGFDRLADKQAAGAVTEDEHTRPWTMYGCNKLYCENLGRYYAKHYRQLARDRMEQVLDFRCLRYPGLISADTIPSGGTSDYAAEMIHAAAEGKSYTCFVREDTRIPFMTMPDAIDGLVALAVAPEANLTRCVYNVTAFNPSAGELADQVRRHFPGAEITFSPDMPRQAIVDSWPIEVNDQRARADWGFAPRHDLESAFDDYLVPRIRSRYNGGQGNNK